MKNPREAHLEGTLKSDTDIDIMELVQFAENVELHHESRDGGYLRPEELRGLLRRMYYLLCDLYELSRGSVSD